MMPAIHHFRERQEDLRRRLARLPARTLVRRRLERELRGLVMEELQQELTGDTRMATPPEYSEDEGQPLQWWQK